MFSRRASLPPPFRLRMSTYSNNSRKRSRLSSSSATPAPTPSPASAALKSCIALLASLDLPHASFSPLLDSLTSAHKVLVDQGAEHAVQLAEAELGAQDSWGWGRRRGR